MKIAVTGAGAMGCLLGGTLARAGHDVQLVDVRPEQIAPLAERKLQVTSTDGDFEVQVGAGTNYDGPEAPELVLVCVKSYDTERAAARIATWLGEATTVLTLQNGVGNLGHLARLLPRDQLLVGTTAIGANLLAPGRVHHAGQGETHLGDISGDASARAEAVAALFTAAGFPTEAVTDIQRLIWSKLAVNVGINALTALLRVRNGQLLELGGAESVMETAVAECLAVADACDITLDHAAVSARVKEVARLTAANRSSMLMDVLGGRPTEIDAINGAVARRGRELGIPVPVNETLTHLVRALQQVRAIPD